MTDPADAVTTLDVRPGTRQFLRDVLRRLSRTPKRLSAKYFYDARGSQLFDDICLLPEYYPTRTELQIMEHSADEMAAVIGPQAVVIEYGSGSSLKTRLLLNALDEPLAYLPVDISREHLERAAQSIAEDYPNIDVRSIPADFTCAFSLPDDIAHTPHRTVYFPGSTIGNFTPRQAVKLLDRIHTQCGQGGGLLLGLDLVKDRDVLLAAYNDAAGVTADFNLNLLMRINRELEADFDLDAFKHEAIWNEEKSRIEMHLRSLCKQSVTIADERIEFDRGETICTEYSHKYTREQLDRMAVRSGFTVQQIWTDSNDWFGVAFLTAS